MELTVVNVGPIRSASLEITPLTVLVGPNNSGKSVLLAIGYAALAQFGGPLPLEMTRPIRRQPVRREEENVELAAALMELPTAARKPEFDSLPGEAQSFLRDRIHSAIDIYSKLFIEQLVRTTGSPIQDLRRANKGTSPSYIMVTSSAPEWSVTVRITAASHRVEVARPVIEEVWRLLDNEAWKRYRNRARRLGRPSVNAILNDLTIEVLRGCFRDYPRHTRYMPAARSGLIQSQKALAGSLVRRASYAGIRDMQIPAVTGIIADFLGEMIEIDGDLQFGQFDQQARQLEEEILRGKIVLEEDPSGGYSELLYRSQDGEFPLGRTSSMISELAPVVLFLRYLMQRRDLLMIEEPEAHLHPQAQVAFAKAIVRLINDGLNIAMTTHSEFFLQQLNNAVMAASIGPTDSAHIKLDEQARITAKKVSAYLFCPDDSGNGTEVVKLRVDAREGIPESSFSDVAGYLYDQTVALDKRVNGESQK